MNIHRSLFVAYIALHGACAHIPTGIEKPTADVEGVAVGEVSFTGLTGELDLAIFNPNGFGVPLESVEWELAIGSATAVAGTFTLSETIPARSSAPVKAALAIGTSDAMRVGAELAGGAHTYTVRGTLRFSTRVGPIAVSFEHRGELASMTGSRSRQPAQVLLSNAK